MGSEEENIRTDRDLLVELRTEMRGVRNDIKELKDNTSQRLERLERDVSSLKIWRGTIIGALALITFAEPIVLAYFKV